MPYANNGVKIYYEVEGQGPPLVLAHGGMSDISGWRRYGYSDALRNDYRLVLFDARGHGQSDKPHSVSDYGTNMVEDVVIVLETLGIDKANYFGYSMGAMVGLLAAIRFPNRFSSLILGGEARGVYNNNAVSAESKQMLAAWRLMITDRAAYVLRRERMAGRSLTPEELNIILGTDAEALVSLGTSLLPPEVFPVTDNDLSTISVPVLIYCGELDVRCSGSKEAVPNMPYARFFSLPDIDHFTAFWRSDLVLPHIKEFLAQVSKK
jgi:pimeloyl-ACP methyl ester carboxylesterase